MLSSNGDPAVAIGCGLSAGRTAEVLQEMVDVTPLEDLRSAIEALPMFSAVTAVPGANSRASASWYAVARSASTPSMSKPIRKVIECLRYHRCAYDCDHPYKQEGRRKP